MWVYMRDKDTKEYEVGFFRSDTAWEAVASFDNELHARGLVNYLNGGTGQSQGRIAVEVFEA